MSTPYKLYTHINKLPLSLFMEVLCDANLQALVIEGEVPQQVLEDAWAEIQSQYSDAVADLDYKMYLSLFKEIHRLTITIQQIELLVSLLRCYYVELLAVKLNKLLGTKCKFNKDNLIEYNNDLNKCAARAKGYGIQLDLKTISFKKLQTKLEGNKGKITREYFSSMTNLLEEQFGATINEEQTTVFKYVDRVKRLQKQIEHNVKKR